MGVVLSVRSEGFVELERDLGHLAATAQFALLRRINRERARVIANRARLTTLFMDRTGILRNSIFVRQGPKDIEAFVVADTPYAGYVHGGTRTQAPRPFLDEANELTEQEQLEVTNRILLQSLQRLRAGQRDIGAGFAFSRSL